MENLKIRVNGEVENKEAQGIFKILGGSWSEHVNADHYDKEFLYLTNGVIEYDDLLSEFLAVDECKEITLPELRDLVVLNRNDAGDANVLEDNCLYDLYLTKSRELYFYHCGKNKWILSNLNGDDFYYELLKPIEKPMKEPKQAEFLVKTDSGYVLQVLDENAGGEGVVRIPDGAEIAILASGVVYFWKSHFFNGGVHKDWVDMKEGWDASWYLKSVPSAITIWQRETLNDQVASAEVARQESKEWDLGDYDFAESDALIESNVEQSSIVKTLAERQSTYGDFSKVAEMTQGLLFVMSQYGYSDMPDTHKESIHMIASKLARIVNGDNNHLDSWHDIGGYSKLIENLIKSVND